MRLFVALTLVGAVSACNGGDAPSEEAPVATPTVDEQPDADDTDEPADGDTDASDEDGASEPDDTEAEGAPPLEGSPTTDRQTEEPTAGVLAVTDVRVATHGGFDRIVFDIGGDGQGTVGWNIEYVETPTSQGSGHDVDVAGDAHLSVSVVGVTLPPELPADLEAYTQGTEGPDGGVVQEIVYDSIFEGHHQFFVGLDAEHPYVVQRLDEPQRLVIDVHHD